MTMSSFAAFPVFIECPRCGRHGDTYARELHNTAGDQVGFSLDNAPAGFSIRQDAQTRSDVIVLCACGCEFRIPTPTDFTVATLKGLSLH